jgi:flagellar hook-basal body complex protein FliE
MTIDQLISTGAIAPTVAPATASPGGPAFSDQLKSAIESVNDKQLQADSHLQAVASGQDVDLHTTMIALQEADITLRAMVSVRDKVVDAYQQVMNMSI